MAASGLTAAGAGGGGGGPVGGGGGDNVVLFGDQFDLLAGVEIREIAGRGRGLVTDRSISAGSVILTESAVAAIKVKFEQPGIVQTAELAIAIITAGPDAVARCETLEPLFSNEYAAHPGKAARQHELTRGRILVTEKLAQAGTACALTEAEIERLLLALTLNCHGLRPPPANEQHSGIFPGRATMTNHSDRPNLCVQGVFAAPETGAAPPPSTASNVSGGAPSVQAAPAAVSVALVDGGTTRGIGTDAQLTIRLRAIRDIAAGEELTICYLDTLYASFPERDEQLSDRYFFGAEHLATDASLEALAPGISAADAQRLTPLVVGANEVAGNAWDRATDAIGKGTAASASVVQRLRSLAGIKYAELIGSGLLAESHAWHFNAARRLALLKNSRRDPDLALWGQVVRSGTQIWPPGHWMEARPLLRGAVAAAMLAGEPVQAAEYHGQLLALERTLGLTLTPMAAADYDQE